MKNMIIRNNNKIKRDYVNRTITKEEVKDKLTKTVAILLESLDEGIITCDEVIECIEHCTETANAIN